MKFTIGRNNAPLATVQSATTAREWLKNNTELAEDQLPSTEKLHEMALEDWARFVIGFDWWIKAEFDWENAYELHKQACWAADAVASSEVEFLRDVIDTILRDADDGEPKTYEELVTLLWGVR